MQRGGENDKLEERAQPRDKNGKFASTGGGIRRKKGRTKYSPSPQRNKSGIILKPEKYAKLCGTFNTSFPNLTPKDGYRTIFDDGHSYRASADGYGGIKINKKYKIG